MYRISKLIASTNASFSLKNNSQTVAVTFLENWNIETLLLQIDSQSSGSAKNLSLHFENIRGNDLLPVIDVYLNLERENMPEENNYVGSMGLYGLGESSTPSQEHDGAGQERLFDVGAVFARVHSQSNWSNKQFNLTLIPNHSLMADAILTIERITLYFNES
jgi:tyrosinase